MFGKSFNNLRKHASLKERSEMTLLHVFPHFVTEVKDSNKNTVFLMSFLI